PAALAAAHEIHELREPGLLRAGHRREHAEVRDREARLKVPEHGNQLTREPARGEEVEHPAAPGAARVERADALHQAHRKSGLGRLDRIHVDPHAAYAGGVEAL